MSNTPFPLGADLGNPDAYNASNEAAFQTNYNSFVSVMGTAPQYLDSAIDYTQPVNAWVGSASEQAQSQAQASSASGLTPVIGLPMYSNASGSASPDQQFKAFASGQYDSLIQGIVSAYTSQGFHNLDFRLGWEMNLPGTPTFVGSDAQSQADWVSAFQHISTVLHQAAAADGANVQVIWNPGTSNYSTAEATNNLYPGNNYVDAIGADVYADASPYQDSPGQYHDWATGGEDSLSQFIASPVNRQHYWNYPAANEYSNDASGGHSQSFASLLQFAEQQGKPFAVPETAAGNSSAGADVSDDPAFPAWLSSQLSAAQASGEKIDMVNLWDTNSGGSNNEFSNSWDNKPQEAAAWAQYFGANGSSAASSSLPPSGASSGSGSSSGSSSPSSPSTSGTTYNPGSAGGTITTTGPDTVNVGSGAVTVNANGPSVNVVGGGGRLTFIGSSGNDTVSGGSGDVGINGNGDTLDFTAGSGYSTINAGSGSETYNIVDGQAGGFLKISGFVPGLDSIHLSGFGQNAVVTDGVGGGSTYLTLTDNTTIALVGLTQSGTQGLFS